MHAVTTRLCLITWSKGRGGYPTGLAPAVSSNFNPANAGGGIFIAYATEAGSVALDGQGQHSPFTEALLRNLDKPISIDDMFSLVTREVRLVTKECTATIQIRVARKILFASPVVAPPLSRLCRRRRYPAGQAF